MLKNELFHSYVDEGFEKEFMSLESAFDIEMEKLALAYEYSERLYEIKLMEANARVLNESGTYEDIATLYENAAQENKEKSGNIISNAFKAIARFIGNFFKKLGEFFSGNKEKDLKNSNATIEGPMLSNVTSKISTAVNKFSNFLNPNKPISVENGNEAEKVVADVINSIQNIAVGVVSIKTYITAYDMVKGALSDAKTKIEESDVTKYVGDGVTKVKDALKNFVDALTGLIKKAAEKANALWNKLFGSKSEKNDDNANAIEDKSATNATSEENQNKDQNNDDQSGKEEVVNASADDFIAGEELMETCDDIITLIDNL